FIWLPYGLRGTRVFAVALWLTLIDTVGLLAIHFKPPTLLMLALFAPQIPLVFGLGYYGVSKARHGHVPERGRAVRKAAVTTKALPPFASAKSAHFWLEWQEHGRTLFSLVAMLVPLELLLLFFADGSTGFVFLVLGLAAMTP